MTINQSQRTKIGVKAIEAMPPHSIIWDTAIPGFIARRQNSPVVTYSVVYRTLEGVQRWQRLGRRGVWTPDLARREAERVLRARDLGEDPAGARMALRTGMTVAQLCDQYGARENGKKPATIKSDNSMINLYISRSSGSSAPPRSRGNTWKISCTPFPRERGQDSQPLERDVHLRG